MKRPHEMRPGNRYARETGSMRTLGDMVRAKLALVAICRRCKHRRLLFPANHIARFGDNFPAIDLRERLRCTNCRYRSANLHEASR
jgi:DNA-directed RNA polymerase subunit RPC12/RpoP